MNITIAIINAKVLTQDEQAPYAEAVALSGHRIAMVGSTSQIKELVRPQTRVVDAAGASVLPGIIDSHYHLVKSALQLAYPDLGAVRTLEDLKRRMLGHSWANEWMVGYQLGYGIMPHGAPLTRHDLDSISSDRPMILFSSDLHVAWANTCALERGGRLSGGTSSANSEVVMGKDGTALGELREPGAYRVIENMIPPLDRRSKLAAVKLASAQAASFGITSIHNMDGDWEQLSLLEELEQNGELLVRVVLPFRIYPKDADRLLRDAIEAGKRTPSGFIRTGLAKFLLDGVLEGRTAYLLQEYADKPGHRGEPNYDPEHFEFLATQADRAGLQIACHAIGDAAVRQALDVYENIARNGEKRPRRHRIEHIELIDPGDISRFAAGGIIPAMQPLHAPGAAPMVGRGDAWTDALGSARLANAFCWQRLFASGARLAFGSDWSVVTQNPFIGLDRCVRRELWGDAIKSEALTMRQALRAYTVNGAFAEFSEHQKGMIRSNMLADLIVLDRDLEKTQDMVGTRVLLTITNGQIVSSSGMVA